jgi:glycosyltransferase involved in cell wall biosynthesis
MAEPLRAATVGITETPTAGMRDYARLLALALPAQGIECSLHWLDRDSGSLRAERAQIAAWRRRLASDLADERPQAVVLHYSPFAYAHRGVPVFGHSLLTELVRTGVPLVTILHELAYPWARPGARQKAWAVTQRAALADVMRHTSAAVVTMDSRSAWLHESRWVARRPIEVVPVFSNLPELDGTPAVVPGRIGLFGYGYEGVEMELVLDALNLLRAVTLRLLGGPGPRSARAEAWRAAAAARGLDGRVEFSGVLPADGLARELASCELLLSAVDTGPTSRKGTVAASLASGRPLLAIDGPQTWAPLVADGALAVAEPTAQEIAGAIERLRSDERLREELGARGQAFARERLSVAAAAGAVARLIRRLSQA